MSQNTFLLTLVLASLMTTPLMAQRPGKLRMKEKEDAFLQEAPRVGDAFPDVSIYTPDGETFNTDSTRGKYSVWTFGCLTCPPSIWNIAGLEAVQRDYGPQGVQFFFVYKSLAHPELVGNYVQPFTLDERLFQARQASKQFGTQIPWVVDAMDNRLKHALGDRPNSQFIVDPSGVIVRKRAWSNPAAVREDLASLVGTAPTFTQLDDLKLDLKETIKPTAEKGVVTQVSRSGMQPIMMQPEVTNSGHAFLAKLRPEGDDSLLREGRGNLYLGFHLDPLHGAHWNNLVEPLKIEIEASDAFVTAQRELVASKPNVASDSDPREFLLHIEAWPNDLPITVIATYRTCVGEECLLLSDRYELKLNRDENGGGARGRGPGLWTTEEFTGRMLADDRNRDGHLSQAEVSGLLLPHFQKLDRNGDQVLEASELDVVTQWINTHHQPGTPEDSRSTSP